MIEIGRSFINGLRTAQQQARQEKNKNNTLAQQTQQALEELQQTYDEQMNYLFRSSVEKNQLAYSRALAQLAAAEAKRAAKGVSNSSSSAVNEKQTSLLQQQLAKQTVQQQLQTQAAQTEHTFQEKWKSLWQAVAQYRKQTGRGSRFGNIGKAFLSLFN